MSTHNEPNWKKRVKKLTLLKEDEKNERSIVHRLNFGVARALAEKNRIEAESVLPFAYLTYKIHFTVHTWRH